MVRKLIATLTAALLLGGGFGSLAAYAAGNPTPAVKEDSLTLVGQNGPANMWVHSSACFAVLQLGVAARDVSSNANADYPDPVYNASICPSGYFYSSGAPNPNFKTGHTYRVFGYYRTSDHQWHNLPAQTLSIPAAAPAPTQVPGQPWGPSGTWTETFGDEFNGPSVDTSKWSFQSTAEGDFTSNPLGTGPQGQNQQLEFDTNRNCSEHDGELDITAKPDSITSASGYHYNWSSCMINSSPSYAFRYGYIEMRAQMPGPAGFWPALWTWQVPGTHLSGNGETDAVEYYSNDPQHLDLTQHNQPTAGMGYVPPFNPSSGMHTYGVDIAPDGTTWYVDGVNVFHCTSTSAGMTNINIDNFVYSVAPPAPGSSGHLLVDYVRAFTH